MVAAIVVVVLADEISLQLLRVDLLPKSDIIRLL